MSHVSHPPSGTFLHPWFDHLRPRPKMVPPLGGCRDESRAIGLPPGGSDETNMSHVPHPPSGTFLHPWFDHLRPRPKMAPLGGCRDGSDSDSQTQTILFDKKKRYKWNLQETDRKTYVLCSSYKNMLQNSVRRPLLRISPLS